MSRADWPVELDPHMGCWVWTGHRDKRDGRAIVWRGKSPINAYRVVFEAEVGPIPEGLVLGHWCANASCVAPHHVEPMTKSVNEKQKSWRYMSRLTKCKNGHDLTVNRIVTTNGGLCCRQCNRDSEAAQ